MGGAYVRLLSDSPRWYYSERSLPRSCPSPPQNPYKIPHCPWDQPSSLGSFITLQSHPTSDTQLCTLVGLSFLTSLCSGLCISYSLYMEQSSPSDTLFLANLCLAFKAQLHSLIQHVFIEHLLCAMQCTKVLEIKW